MRRFEGCAGIDRLKPKPLKQHAVRFVTCNRMNLFVHIAHLRHLDLPGHYSVASEGWSRRCSLVYRDCSRPLGGSCRSATNKTPQGRCSRILNACGLPTSTYSMSQNGGSYTGWMYCFGMKTGGRFGMNRSPVHAFCSREVGSIAQQKHCASVSTIVSNVHRRNTQVGN